MPAKGTALLIVEPQRDHGFRAPTAGTLASAVLTPYPVAFGGLWRTNPVPAMSGLNSKTALVDSGGRSTVCLAVRRSGVRIPSGPPNFSIDVQRDVNFYSPEPTANDGIWQYAHPTATTTISQTL